MNRQQILDLYDWALGVCFRHPGKGRVATAHAVTVRPAAGGLQDVRACEDCVIAMEGERERAAQRAGRPYRPGRLAADE
ncbi:hypothetical protein ACIGXF_16375 [Streptomyces sp. NPDC053086]|uniref:hypothetical protein n=1 Tax=unclassified Streptomyces TaxID=2593676 RepID=UPI0037D624CF